ncbi:DUF551 domain-containing protein [Enterobacter hormaechei]|uniref:DUF551 domain-containing protein n=1 Tax=Enterobacter hormaechei TaxID=158836 RepID=UPI003AB4BCB5
MAELTKEWLLTTIAELEEERDATPGAVNEDAAMALAAMKIALASLEAEPGRNPVLAYADNYRDMAKHGVESIPVWSVITDLERNIAPLYIAHPAPVSVPAAMEMGDDFDSSFEHGKAVGWNACRAAMPHGVDRPQNEPQNIPENIPATQFKPVADLYGLTSPTGCETSFTFDAVEARDFIDGGWSCQEYVELERFQEAITNHTEDKLAMADHSGDSNNMVEPVTTAYKLPANVIDALEKALQAMSFMGDTLNDMDAVCEEDVEYVTPAFDAVRKVLEGNYPVMPDGWVACSERMPDKGQNVLISVNFDSPLIEPLICSARYTGSTFRRGDVTVKPGEGVEEVTHWMPLPAAPQQEA